MDNKFRTIAHTTSYHYDPVISLTVALLKKKILTVDDIRASIDIVQELDGTPHIEALDCLDKIMKRYYEDEVNQYFKSILEKGNG